MDRIARGLFGIAVLISLIQTLHAITQEEYQQRTDAIKSNKDIVQFLKDNTFMISQYGVFFDKLADMFSHVRKTQAGKETMDHVGGEVETILKQERTYSFIKSILEAARKVLTSEVGLKNIFSVANFIQDELQVPKLFEMCISLKKIILYILLSENGLRSLVMIKENNFVLEKSKDTAAMMEMLNNDFPILSLPADMSESDGELEAKQKRENVSEMKSLLGRMESINRQ